MREKAVTFLCRRTKELDDDDPTPTSFLYRADAGGLRPADGRRSARLADAEAWEGWWWVGGGRGWLNLTTAIPCCGKKN